MGMEPTTSRILVAYLCSCATAGLNTYIFEQSKIHTYIIHSLPNKVFCCIQKETRNDNINLFYSSRIQERSSKNVEVLKYSRCMYRMQGHGVGTLPYIFGA